jgi:nucleoside-diphosphate-sugar epimerase
MGWEHVIPQFAVRVSELGERHPTGCLPFEIRGDGRQTRAFVHIDDFIDGLMCVIERGEHLNVYHIGNPEEVSVDDLARRVARCLGRELEIVSGAAFAGETQRRCPDIGKLRRLGYEPRISLDRGLPEVVRWYHENRERQPRRDSVGAAG